MRSGSNGVKCPRTASATHPNGHVLLDAIVCEGLAVVVEVGDELPERGRGTVAGLRGDPSQRKRLRGERDSCDGF